MDLLVVSVEGRIVHEPLQAAIIVSGIRAIIVESDIDSLRRRRRPTRTIGEQWHRHIQRVLRRTLSGRILTRPFPTQHDRSVPTCHNGRLTLPQMESSYGVTAEDGAAVRFACS